MLFIIRKHELKSELCHRMAVVSGKAKMITT